MFAVWKIYTDRAGTLARGVVYACATLNGVDEDIIQMALFTNYERDLLFSGGTYNTDEYYEPPPW